MAINKNHEFEELNGVKCAIVEKNASKQRVEFLKKLLEFNEYTVVVVPSPPPKVAAPPPKPAAPPTPPVSGDISTEQGTQPLPQPLPQPQPLPITSGTEPQPQPEPEIPPAPETFTIGVTDVTFNPTNALFGRLLHTPDGHVVTVAYWQQKESESHDEVPYYEQK